MLTSSVMRLMQDSTVSESSEARLTNIGFYHVTQKKVGELNIYYNGMKCSQAETSTLCQNLGYECENYVGRVIP